MMLYESKLYWMGIDTHRQTDRQAGRQTDRQTHTLSTKPRCTHNGKLTYTDGSLGRDDPW